MCLGDVLAANIDKHPMNLNDDVTMSSCDNIIPTRDTPNIQDSPYIHGMALYTGVLTFEDFEVIDPHRAKFLRQLKQLVAQKQAIINDSTLGEDEQGEKLKARTLETPAVKLEHLSLSFTFNPSSRVYGYDEVELCTNGSQIDVTLDNVEQYIDCIFI